MSTKEETVERRTFRICLFHSWPAMRTFTAFDILPADTTTPTFDDDTFFLRYWPSRFAGRTVRGIATVV